MTPSSSANLLLDPAHQQVLLDDARRQLRFFDNSLRSDGGFDVLALDGVPLPRAAQELHTTTRLIHAYALGTAIGHPAAEERVDAGMAFLWARHRDPVQGGYRWSVGDRGTGRADKLAYGHVFVLLAAASAKQIGHPDADRLLADTAEILERHFWDEQTGRLREEFTPDWTPLSGYRGMNANMHGVEAMLAAYEATGETLWLTRAGRVLAFFTNEMPARHNWRIPEHYTEDWRVDPTYAGDPMFRPAGTTPGHSVEFARLLVQHWDLCGRPDTDAIPRAQRLVAQALCDAWLPDGGMAYTLDPSGDVAIAERYWWPVTEAIGALASLLKVRPAPELATWYARCWDFARAHLMDEKGGWFPELDDLGHPAEKQFRGKPDLYHALQACLFPLADGVSRPFDALFALRG